MGGKRIRSEWRVFFGSFVEVRGASNLYASGIDLEVIRRFGRWRSSSFHLYLWGDSRALRNLTSSLTAYNGLAENVKVKQGVRTETDEKKPDIVGTINRNHDRRTCEAFEGEILFPSGQ